MAGRLAGTTRIVRRMGPDTPQPETVAEDEAAR